LSSHQAYKRRRAHRVNALSCHSRPWDDGERCGSSGDSVCSSFYASKHITTGEGSMIVGDDCPRFRLIRVRSSWSLSFNPQKRFAADELAECTKLDAQFGRKRDRARAFL
jgi:dTDP-4-amino-4,6-dideoxygalactose transaminase